MARHEKVKAPRRGEVYLVSFDPALGAEIKKTRPALILQNDIANRFSPITIIAAITSQLGERLYPTEALIRAPEGGLSQDGVVLLNQIRSIDKRRLLRRLGKLNWQTLRQVEKALVMSFGLIDV